MLELSPRVRKTDTILAAKSREQYDGLYVANLWESRARGSLGIAEAVNQKPDHAAPELDLADEGHSKLCADIDVKDQTSCYLLQMKRRSLLEVRLQLGGHSGSDLIDMTLKALASNPGCADTQFLAGKSYEKSGKHEQAIGALKGADRMGTPSSTNAACALTSVHQEVLRDDDGANEWTQAAETILSKLKLSALESGFVTAKKIEVLN